MPANHNYKKLGVYSINSCFSTFGAFLHQYVPCFYWAEMAEKNIILFESLFMLIKYHGLLTYIIFLPGLDFRNMKHLQLLNETIAINQISLHLVNHLNCVHKGLSMTHVELLFS